MNSVQAHAGRRGRLPGESRDLRRDPVASGDESRKALALLSDDGGGRTRDEARVGELGGGLADLAVDAEVDLGTTDGAYFLQARLTVSMPGTEPELARALVEEAHQTCPYSKATRGNINVELKLA